MSCAGERTREPRSWRDWRDEHEWDLRVASWDTRHVSTRLATRPDDELRPPIHEVPGVERSRESALSSASAVRRALDACYEALRRRGATRVQWIENGEKREINLNDLTAAEAEWRRNVAWGHQIPAEITAQALAVLAQASDDDGEEADPRAIVDLLSAIRSSRSKGA